MDNEQLELLKQKLISLHYNPYSGPTREEIEIIVNSSIDAIADIAEDAATKILIEHCSTFDHNYKEEY